jgi:hypothetical protein
VETPGLPLRARWTGPPRKRACSLRDEEAAGAEILAAASALAGRPVGVDMLEGAAEAGLIRFDDGHVHFGHPLVRAGVLRPEPVTRRYPANARWPTRFWHEPYRRIWHRSQSIAGPDDEVADELAWRPAVFIPSP